MKRLYQFKISVLILAILLVVTTFIFSKSYYLDGNYSEYGGCSPMCMRCHMCGLLSPGVGPPTMSIQASKTTARCGDIIAITVKISKFDAAWNPGIGIFTDINSPYGNHSPWVYGWQILSSPNGNTFSYIKPKTKDSTFIWQVIAPQLPGSYRIATSAYFVDYSSGKACEGTKRGDNSLVIQVNRNADTVKPILKSVSSSYKNFIFLTFSKPVDSADVVNKSNYIILNKSVNTNVNISNISRSRDGKIVTLQTEDLYSNNDYSININNIHDYSIQPNKIVPVTIDFKTVVSTPYRIYAEWSLDATVNSNNEADMTEYVGNIDGMNISRSEFCFFLPKNMQDLLPVTNFKSAKLYLTQQQAAVPFTSNSDIKWDVHKLLPGNTSSDGVENMNTPQENFAGHNQQNQPIASIMKKNSVGNENSYWIWDITTDFQQRFANLGGSGTNANDYYLRVKASNEINLGDGVGFYGSDADSVLNKPYIELSFDTGINSVENTKKINDNINLQIVPNIGNGLSVINYQLLESGFIKLSIINMLGLEISVLKQEFEKTGNYNYQLSITDYQLNSGMYFIRLSASGQVSTSKIIVIK